MSPEPRLENVLAFREAVDVTIHSQQATRESRRPHVRGVAKYAFGLHINDIWSNFHQVFILIIYFNLISH